MPPKPKANPFSNNNTGGFFTVSTREAKAHQRKVKQAEPPPPRITPAENKIKQKIAANKALAAGTSVNVVVEQKHKNCPVAFSSVKKYQEFFQPLIELEREGDKQKTQISIPKLDITWNIQLKRTGETNAVASFEMSYEERAHYSLRGGAIVQLVCKVSSSERIVERAPGGIFEKVKSGEKKQNNIGAKAKVWNDIYDSGDYDYDDDDMYGFSDDDDYDDSDASYIKLTGYLAQISPIKDTINVIIDPSDDHTARVQFAERHLPYRQWKLSVLFHGITYDRMNIALAKMTGFNSALMKIFLGNKRHDEKDDDDDDGDDDTAAVRMVEQKPIVNDDVNNKKNKRLVGGDWRSKGVVFDAKFLPQQVTSAPTLRALNDSQVEAIKLALTQPVGTIVGPPGTGKTTTLSNLVYHLYKIRKAQLKQQTDEYYREYCHVKNPSDLVEMIQRVKSNPPPPPEKPSPILVSAPSNVATDHLASVLLKIPGLDVLRISSKRYQTVNFSTLDDEVENCALHRRIESWMLQNPDSELAKLNQKLFGGLSDTSTLAARLDSIFNDDQYEEKLAKQKEKLKKATASIMERRSKLNQDDNAVSKVLGWSMHQDPQFINYLTVKLGSRLNSGLKAAQMSDKQMWSMLYYRLQGEIIQNADVICATFALCGNPIIFNDHIKLEHVLLDEVSQSTEPQLLLPLAYSPKHLVLFGDRKQLGPIVTSDQARLGGLDRSLFERLVATRACPSVVLNTQYRMHPSISKFSADKFYNGRLQNGVGPEARHCFATKFPWPNPANPICFVSTAGLGVEEWLGTSAINDEDCRVVVKLLTNFVRQGVPLSDIGVVVPYRAQANQITRELCKERSPFMNLIMSLYSGVSDVRANPYDQKNKVNFRDPGNTMQKFQHHHYKEFTIDSAVELITEQLEISSVDAFQGKEKSLIVFNTVRTRGLNFLTENRLNVAITRAKNGMIIVGDHRNLNSGIFRELLELYYNFNAFVGPANQEIFWEKFSAIVVQTIESRTKADAIRDEQLRREERAMVNKKLEEKPTLLSKHAPPFFPAGMGPA